MKIDKIDQKKMRAKIRKKYFNQAYTRINKKFARINNLTTLHEIEDLIDNDKDTWKEEEE